MNSATGKTIAPSSQPALELITLARLSPERARQSLRALLMANPNYFGNITGSSFKAVLNIHEDTSYESIGSVEYNPQLQHLRATIHINQNNGYSDDMGAGGSVEYLRFYLSYDGGATWQDQGLRPICVFDLAGPKPFVYAVILQIIPSDELRHGQNLPRVRAILSWISPPPAGAPNWTPVWGNVVDAQMRIDGFGFIPLSTFTPASSVSTSHSAEFKDYE